MTAPRGHPSAGPGVHAAPGALRVLLDLVSGLVGFTSQVAVSPPRARLTPLLELPGPFREIVEGAPDAIIVHVQGRYVYANRAAVRLFGARDAADLLGTLLIDRVHPDDREFARDRIRQSQSGGELPPVTDLRLLRMDGTTVDVEVRASRFLWNDRPAVQEVIREISDRKRGEQLQEAVYRIAQAADQAITLEDLYREIHTIVSGVMPADNFFIAYYDRDKDILSFPYFVDQVDTVPGPRPAGHTLTEYVLRTGKSLLCTEEVDAALRASGEVELVGEPSAIWLGVPLLSCDKTIGAMVVQHYSDPQAYGERERQMLEFVSSQVAQAIDRKSQLLARAGAEAALRDSEERYRNLVENAPVGIYRTTPDGHILAANPTIVRMLGYNSFEELVRFNLEREGRAAGYRGKRFAEMLEHDGVVRGLESAWRRRDGAEIYVRENAQAVRAPDGEILYYDGTVEDITERRRVEESERELRALAEALRDTAALLNSTLNQDQVMDLMLSNLGRVVPHDASSIMLVENGIGRIVRTRGYAERGADAEIRAVEFRMDDLPLLREIAQSGRPAVIPDTRAFPAWARLPHTDWIRSHASAPLRVRGETVGFVGVGSTIPGFFKEQHGARLQAFADQASIALENARLLSETERRANQFAALYETAQELAFPRDLAVRLDGIVDRARALLAAQGAFIYLYDEAHDELALTIEKGMGIPAGLRLKVGEGLAGRVAETRQPQLVENYSAWENRSGAYEGRELRAIVEVPMIHAGELLGVLGVSEMEGLTRRFGEEDLQLLTLFAGQAASAIKSARLLDETGTRARQLALLYDAGLTLNGVLEPRAQLEFLLKIALRALHADRAEFFRYEASSRELLLESGVDVAGADIRAPASRSNASGEEGPLAWVLKHRVPLNVPSISDDPRTRMMEGQLAAGLWTPVERTGEVRGVLAVFSTRPDAFTLQDERLLVLFANQAAVALENARLYTELAESLALTTQFYHVTGQVLQADSFQETAQLITQALREALNADFASIALVDEGGQYTFEHGIGYPDGFFDRTPEPPDEIAARTLRTGQPVVASDSERFPPAVRKLGVCSGICLPLAGDTGRLGVLFVQYRRPHDFAERELKTLSL
ncbi:MAG: GAF domain-containing protein, partial [Rudaea sp.]